MASLMMLSAVLTLSGGQVESTTTDIEAARREYKEAEAVGAMAEVWDLEHGGLVEGASMEKLEEAETLAEELHECEHKDNLEPMIEAAKEELSTPPMRFYGNARITYYCPLSCCCGAFASGNTASGTRATAGRTVASGDLPFGTRLMINGHEYVVEDRGVGAQQIDIFVDTHAEALQRGLHYSDVWIIE